MNQNFAIIRERSIRNLRELLHIEVDLGMGFAGLAEYYLETGNSERYQTSRRNALAALETVEQFKDRLPPEIRMEIETRRSELAALISPL